MLGVQRHISTPILLSARALLLPPEACSSSPAADRQGLAWESDGVDRVAFGAMKASPRRIGGYLTNGGDDLTGWGY